MTSRSGSEAMMSDSVVRTAAESSTISTRILRSGSGRADIRAISELLEHGGSDLPDGERGTDHRLGMAENDVAARPQVIDEAGDDRILVGFLEIDQHVAEEDDVDVAIERIGLVHQV